MAEGYSTQEQIIKSFDHFIQQRQLFNSSFGKKGSLIVAINCSFGIDYGNPDDFKVWCNIIEEASKIGILVICATTNNHQNVDYVSDMPTSFDCPGMINVTSNDSNNKIIRGYGSRSIHLSCGGEDVFSYQEGGTSFASPLVASAVAQLYQSMSNSQSETMFKNPSKFAQIVKNVILDTVRNGSNKTISSGYLDVHAAIKEFEFQKSLKLNDNIIENLNPKEIILLRYENYTSWLNYKQKKKIMKPGVEYTKVKINQSLDFKQVNYIKPFPLHKRFFQSAMISFYTLSLVNLIFLAQFKSINREYYTILFFTGISSITSCIFFTLICKQPLKPQCALCNILFSMSGYLFILYKN